jgi:hypothetical protein
MLSFFGSSFLGKEDEVIGYFLTLDSVGFILPDSGMLLVAKISCFMTIIEGSSLEGRIVEPFGGTCTELLNYPFISSISRLLTIG